MQKIILFISLICVVSALKFSNVGCNTGKACQFQVEKVSFEGYDLVVYGKNIGPAAIHGGEVAIDVKYKWLGMWWSAYAATELVCANPGVSCNEHGIVVEGNQDKTMRLTMGDSVPPSGSYKGTSTFYNVDVTDKKTIQYCNVQMEWNCDNSKCY